MKFEKFGKEIKNVTLSVFPLDLAERNIFDVLNLLLKKIKDERPDYCQKFVNAITNKLQKKTGNKHLKKESERLSKKISQYENLSESFELVRLHLNYMNETLGITEEQLWQNEKTAFPSENFMTSLYVLFYIHLMTLIELLGRKKGIEFYRESVDNYNEKINAINQKEIYTDLSDMREQLSKSIKKNLYGRIRLFSEVKDGQLIKICRNCEKATGLLNTELTKDKEVFYTVLCYMHIPLAKVWNDNFELILEKSLALGDPYCAYIYFDKRIAKKNVQPSNEFLDDIWASKEWQKENRRETRKKGDEKFSREFQQLGFYAPETLDIIQEIKPLEIAEKSSLIRLNYLLGFIKRNKLGIFQSFVNNLQKTYASMVKVDYYKNQKYDINNSIKEFEHLKEHKQLAINSLNYFLGLLEIPSDTDWVNEKLKIPKGNFFRSFLIPRYQNVRILSDTIGREEAIGLYKIYRTEHAKISTPEDRRFRFDTLEDLRKDDFDDYEGDGNPGWVRIEGIVKNGKFVYRKDSCLYAEAMKDYLDAEFKFLAACYYDYEGTRIQWNKDFILTMEHTIAEGDPYCSCVVHDTKIDWDLTHPSKEYWDSIWPLQKWQKKSD